eukprot:2040063-Rhodomonas_salina.1
MVVSIHCTKEDRYRRLAGGSGGLGLRMPVVPGGMGGGSAIERRVGLDLLEYVSELLLSVQDI